MMPDSANPVQQPQTIIEIRPYRGGWQCFEAAGAIISAVPGTLGLRAVIDATFVGAIAAWLLFRYKPSRFYFAELPKKIFILR
jgi:hypothetical protein